mgnify:CR=1 FL=1
MIRDRDGTSGRRGSGGDHRPVSRCRPAGICSSQTSGKGELEPLAVNGTEAGRRLNRRIEVAIFAGETIRTAAR